MSTIDSDFVLIIGSSQLGDGEPDLGEKLMDSFLGQLLESGTVPGRIICMNTGIFLTTEGSPVLEKLQRLAAAGAAISSCTTCLNYYGRADTLAVGVAGTMRDTVTAMVAARKVIKL
jgi:selenium metabolism protein YedF